MTNFGNKLRHLRKAKGISLRALAHEFGYQTHSYLNEVELGRKEPTVELVLKAARYFDVTTDELLKDEVELNNIGKRIQRNKNKKSNVK